MMMFFASLALDLAVPALILVGLLALEWVSVRLRGGAVLQGRPA
jgi:hypothetical protein